jgi:hypothetical protein
MTLEFSEKGKVFTNVVHKNPISAVVQTTTHLIRGTIHIREGERVKDELDRDDLFLAITDASIMDAGGQVVYQAGFLAVRRSQIVWLIPENEGKDP